MRSGSATKARSQSPLPLFAARLGGNASASQKGGAKGARRPDMVRLDPLIHERTRLAILTVLVMAPGGCSFSDLRDTLSLTDGNLTTHLRTLEEAGLVERFKEGAGRASSTTVQLSAGGRESFRNYLDQLETLVRAARGR